MKKIYLLLALCMGLALGAKSQCAIDSSDNYLGLLPPDTFLPSIVRGTFYDTTIQEYSPDSVVYVGTTSYIYSTYIDTILGFPSGITYSKYPHNDTVYGGGHQCIHISGTTTDSVGVYPLTFVGTMHINSQFLGGDTTLTLQALDSDISSYGVNPFFAYNLTVITLQTCSVDSPGLDSPGVAPVASDLPCIVQNVPYNETLQGRIQSTGVITIEGYTANVTVDSVKIDSIAGLPDGITWVVNPPVLQGGGSGCINFAGTTSLFAGTYPLTAFGTVWFTGTIDGQSGPYTYNGNLNQFSPFGGYYVRVVTVNDSCILTAGIHNYFNSLNAEVSVFPNPTSGVFELKINAASPVSGKLLVFDELGRSVYEQPLDVLGVYSTTLDLSKFASGLYTLQIRTPQGYASKKISVQ